MNHNNNLEVFNKSCFSKEIFDEKVRSVIERNNYWNLWVPEDYGGMGKSLSEGLHLLKDLAKLDGSLGWTITLGGGANYFIGNLQPETADELFNSSENTRLGGSGSMAGKAVKNGDYYTISGTWPYATGSHYLTHFTLNATLYEGEEKLLNEDGSDQFRSFIIPRKEVQIIEDWDAMGLKASVTCSFSVEAVPVHSKYSFIYDKQYLPQSIYKIPFSVFADLTLWVNYIGMAEHFYEEALKNKPASILSELKESIANINKQLSYAIVQTEEKTSNTNGFTSDFESELHDTAATSVKQLNQSMISVYPLLGIRATSINDPLNQIFRDYFTATQHHIFTK